MARPGLKKKKQLVWHLSRALPRPSAALLPRREPSSRHQRRHFGRSELLGLSRLFCIARRRCPPRQPSASLSTCLRSRLQLRHGLHPNTRLLSAQAEIVLPLQGAPQTISSVAPQGAIFAAPAQACPLGMSESKELRNFFFFLSAQAVPTTTTTTVGEPVYLPPVTAPAEAPPESACRAHMRARGSMSLMA